jgi:FHA domain
MSDDSGPPPSEVTKSGEEPERCPLCDAPRAGGDRFCENDGYDFEQPDEPAHNGCGWELLIEPDRALFARYSAGNLDFPADEPPLRAVLDRAEMALGRHVTGPDGPELTGAANDPALSRRHAVLIRQDDGRYAIKDLGSTNGTELNGHPLAADSPVVLDDGDRVTLGAWTRMTVFRVPA